MQLTTRPVRMPLLCGVPERTDVHMQAAHPTTVATATRVTPQVTREPPTVTAANAAPLLPPDPSDELLLHPATVVSTAWVTHVTGNPATFIAAKLASVEPVSLFWLTMAAFVTPSLMNGALSTSSSFNSAAWRGAPCCGVPRDDAYAPPTSDRRVLHGMVRCSCHEHLPCLAESFPETVRVMREEAIGLHKHIPCVVGASSASAAFRLSSSLVPARPVAERVA